MKAVCFDPFRQKQVEIRFRAFDQNKTNHVIWTRDHLSDQTNGFTPLP